MEHNPMASQCIRGRPPPILHFDPESSEFRAGYYDNDGSIHMAATVGTATRTRTLWVLLLIMGVGLVVALGVVFWRTPMERNPVRLPKIPAHLFSVSFVSAEQGWATGEGGIIVATRDGGRSW